MNKICQTQHKGNSMTQFSSLAEQSVSALRDFYESDGDDRINAYGRFARSCSQFANENGYSFLEASTKIHNMFNINGGK